MEMDNKLRKLFLKGFVVSLEKEIDDAKEKLANAVSELKALDGEK